MYGKSKAAFDLYDKVYGGSDTYVGLHFVMTFFSGRSTVSADIFARLLADFVQIKTGNQTTTAIVLEKLKALNNKARQYSFSLYNSNDASLLLELIEEVNSHAVHGTTTTAGGAHHLPSTVGYNALDIRAAIKTFKSGSSNPQLKLTCR